MLTDEKVVRNSRNDENNVERYFRKACSYEIISRRYEKIL